MKKIFIIVVMIMSVSTIQYGQVLERLDHESDQLRIIGEPYEFKQSQYFYGEIVSDSDYGLYRLKDNDTVATKIIDIEYTFDPSFFDFYDSDKFLYGDDDEMFTTTGDVGSFNHHYFILAEDCFPYEGQQLATFKQIGQEYNRLDIYRKGSLLTYYTLHDKNTYAQVAANDIIKYSNDLIITGTDDYHVPDTLGPYKIKNITDLDIINDYELKQDVLFEGKHNTDYNLRYFTYHTVYYLLTDENGNQQVLRGTEAPLEDVTDQFDVDGKIATINNVRWTTGEKSEKYLIMKYRLSGEDKLRHDLIETQQGFKRTYLPAFTGHQVKLYIENIGDESRLFVQKRDDKNSHLVIYDWKEQEVLDSVVTSGIESDDEHRISTHNNKVYFAREHPEEEQLVAAWYDVMTDQTHYINEGDEYVIDPLTFDFMESNVYISSRVEFGPEKSLWVYYPDGLTSIEEKHVVADQVDIVPNPFDAQCTIDISDHSSNIGSISIHSTTGLSMYRKAFKNNIPEEVRINTGPWESGAYFLKIWDDHGALLSTQKMIKQ